MEEFALMTSGFHSLSLQMGTILMPFSTLQGLREEQKGKALEEMTFLAFVFLSRM